VLEDPFLILLPLVSLTLHNSSSWFLLYFSWSFVHKYFFGQVFTQHML
jgi:hypothetical protein